MSDIPKLRTQRHALLGQGEPAIWLSGGMAALAILMIVLLLGWVAWAGLSTFWPLPVHKVAYVEGDKTVTIYGEPTRENTLVENGQSTSRTLYKSGNFDLTGTDFTWVRADRTQSVATPNWAVIVERTEWGNAYGELEKVVVNGEEFAPADRAWAKFQEVHPQMRELAERKQSIEKHAMGEINHDQNAIRLKLRAAAIRHGEGSQEHKQLEAELQKETADLEKRSLALREELNKLEEQMRVARIVVRTGSGQIVPADRTKPDEAMYVWQVVRAYPANNLGIGEKTGIYLSRWGEYLFDDPREANMEGGVWPAIVGTVLMTMIMVVLVVPIGVIAAIYLREYAKQGLVVSIVRITVNNLAGVPSIVFGVFGLGFFVYLIGRNIDGFFFSERLPDPTIGKTAMLWASLTLSLLTLPVVIVATEEALAAVPRSLREASYGCGATKWQTIWRVVLPRALPGVMTGAILAIARGAGEVAPLMLVGAVKLAPELPIAASAPFFGADRSFMHLGFHIYDLGFQSRNSEAAKNMVYTTTLLLISLVVVLNLCAMWVRNRLRRGYQDGHF